MKLQSLLTIPDSIWDITIINETEAVVCTAYSGYRLIDISNGCLKIIKEHPLPFAAYGSCSFKDKLVAVTRHDQCYAIKMFDLTGKSSDQCPCPVYLMTKSDGKDTTVIATDSNLNAVLFIDSETGKVETVVHGKSPQGITKDTDGNFYVCSFNSNEIILLRPSHGRSFGTEGSAVKERQSARITTSNYSV